MNMWELDYPFGFITGAVIDRVPSHFVRHKFPISLFTHPRTPVNIHQLEYQAVAIVGSPVDPDNPMQKVVDIAAQLCSAPSKSQDIIDRLVGRFAIIQGTLTSGFDIQNDATGMRSVYFDTTYLSTIAGSHAALVADAAKNLDKRRSPIRFALGYPGLATPWKTVDRLPPNHKLSLQSGELSRFLPTRALRNISIEDAWNNALRISERSAHGLRERHPLLMSLTAGLDSRTTLTGVRPLWPEIKFFTYTNGSPKHELDVRVAKSIARRLDLDFTVLDYSDKVYDPKVMYAINRNTFGSHQHKLSAAYLQMFGEMRALHIRTNVLEITRSNLFSMGNQKFRDGPNTAKNLASYYAASGRLEEIPAYLSAFTDYFNKTGLHDVPPSVSRWDLFFIEHRMGAWHSGVLEESDIAFDTTILFNSRQVIESFMAVPERERSDNGILQRIISQKLPEISDIPINPKI